jgi:hypothetical protein
MKKTPRKPYSLAGSKPFDGSEFSAMNQFALSNMPVFLEKLLPGGKIRSNEYVVCNPKRADKPPGSFKICVSGPKVGVWCDFAASVKGHDPISLVAYVRSLKPVEAVHWIRENIVTGNPGAPQPADTPHQPNVATPESSGNAPAAEGETLTMPPPEGAEHPARVLKQMGYRLPDQAWTYRTAEGAICHYVLRWDEVDGSKAIRPLSWVRTTEGEDWALKAWRDRRPLYNLDKIVANPKALIIVCEGEKAADAAGKLYAHAYTRGVVATTSSGGALAAEKTDWSPLAGRSVRIWPDADDAGLKYANDVAKQRLNEIGCKVEIIDAMALAANAPTGGKRPAQEGWDTADAVTEWQDHKALRKAINRSAKPFDPGPAYVSYGPFRMTKENLTVEGKAFGGEPIRICAPFEVLGESRNPGSLEWGKMLRFRDGDGKLHNRVVPNALLQGDPVNLCSLLANEGLAIHPDHKKLLLSYVAGVQSRRRVTVVMRTGWHEIEGRKRFVLPSETIGQEGPELMVLDATAVGPYETKGTLQSWQNSVAQLVADHYLPILALSAAFAGPLLDLAGQDGVGIHFFGASSTGKTTIIQAAASVWGRGSTAGGYVRAWSATRNGLEAAAASANDTVLILDELSVLEAREAGPAIYALANGTGKARMARDTSARETKTWRILVLSTGEIAMETKIAEDRGQKARAGQAVRMLEIPADRGKGFGVFSGRGSYPDAGKLADACKEAAKTNYGTAGPEFVRRLILMSVDQAGAITRSRVAQFVAATVPKGSDGQVVRAAKWFGLLGARESWPRSLA